MQNRQSFRLQNYDYSGAGFYFVTICTQNMDCWFGQINDANMRLSSLGKTAQECWLDIPRHYPHIALDEYVIMPTMCMES